jgi:hypothetical protein
MRMQPEIVGCAVPRYLSGRVYVLKKGQNGMKRVRDINVGKIESVLT